MLWLTKTLHVLAVGLWFGTGIFFTFVVGLSLFGTFDRLTADPKAPRPLWLPMPPEFDRPPPSERFPNPLSKEQGSRVAGAAVGPMFTPYYATQAGAGAVSLLTALAWLGVRSRLNTVRCVVLVLALVGVGFGWWMAGVVHELRNVRSETSDGVLLDPAASEKVAEADRAREEFGRWHGYSLVVNLSTLALVTVATAMAAHLPAAPVGPRRTE
jgi:acyl phosphate:glycerol-3-phosphate acyltransferase